MRERTNGDVVKSAINVNLDAGFPHRHALVLVPRGHGHGGRGAVRSKRGVGRSEVDRSWVENLDGALQKRLHMTLHCAYLGCAL